MQDTEDQDRRRKHNKYLPIVLSPQVCLAAKE